MKRLLYRVYMFLKEHSHSCKFFDQFGLMIQAFLGIICLSALIFKRYIEKPQRPWMIWFFDTLKQIVGQSTQHIANLAISNKIGEHLGLECEWYLNNLMSDCSFGVIFCYLYLQALIYLLRGTRFEFESGDYGQGEPQQEPREKPEECQENNQQNNIQSNHIQRNIQIEASQKENHNYTVQEVKWQCKNVLYQLSWWILIVILSKSTTICILLTFYQSVEDVGSLILMPVKNNPKLKLVFVMIIFPTIFNIIQFWLTDNFIKINIHKDKHIELESDDRQNIEHIEPSEFKEDHFNTHQGNQVLVCEDNLILNEKTKNEEILINIDTKGYTPIPQMDHNA